MIESRGRARVVTAMEDLVIEALQAKINGDPEAERVLASLPTWYDAQQRIVDFLDAGIRFLVLFWARQTGKTTLCAALAAKWLAEGKRGTYFAWETAYVDEVFEAIVGYLGGEDGPLITKCDRNKMLIRTSTGGRLKVWSLKNSPADAGRGGVNHFVIYEESGLIPNLRHHFYNTIVATLAVHQGIALFNGNAKVRGDFNDLHDRAKAGMAGWATTRIESSENPYFPTDELARIRAEYEEQDLLPLFDMEYRAIPMRDFGSPFAAVTGCILAELSTAEPAGWGWDIGEMRDQTIGTALDRAGAMCRYVNARQQGAVDLEDIEDVIYRETGDCEASVDATGVGKGPFEALEKRSILEGRVREYRGSDDLPPSGGIPPRVVDGWASIYEGFNFNDARKQELYGGIRRALMRRSIRVTDRVAESLLKAVYVESTRSSGQSLKIVVANGPAKDDTDSLGLAIRAWLRSDRSPIMPELEHVSDEDLDDAIDAEDALDDEIAAELLAEERERLAAAKKRRDRAAGWR